MKSEIKNKKEWKYNLVELLILILNKVIIYQFLLNLLEGTNHEQLSQKFWGKFMGRCSSRDD